MVARKTPRTSQNVSHSDLAAFIDHTLLKPDATAEAIDALCSEAIEYRFAAVCVNPFYVPRAVKQLDKTGIAIAAVIGFPLGANSWEIKAAETRDALAHGASEIDMVINIGALKNGDYRLVLKDIEAVTQAAPGHVVKAIIETALLTQEEKITACILAKAAGAAFVKTSTGFGPGGANEADVALMRRIVGCDMGVKASGGIRDTATALAMIAAGATRLGTSASISIVRGL